MTPIHNSRRMCDEALGSHARGCLGRGGTAQHAGPRPPRSFALDLPPECKPGGAGPFGECHFTAATGHARQISVTQEAGPTDAFRQPLRTALLRGGPERFLAKLAEREALLAEFDFTYRRAEPAPGAQACIWEAAADLPGGGDSRSVQCLLQDPDDPDQIELFTLVYTDIRQPGVPPDPGFPADAERLFRSLRFAPPGA